MEKIESGVITNILKKLKGLLSDIFEYAVNHYPDNIEGVEVDNDGTVYIKRVTFGGGTVAKVKLSPKDESKNLYHATIECIEGPGKNNRVSKYDKDVTFTPGNNDALVKMLTKYGDEYLGETFETVTTENTDSSIKVNLKLNKITASDNSYKLSVKKAIMGTEIPAVPVSNMLNTTFESDCFDEYADGDIFVSVTDEGNEISIEDIAEADMGEAYLDKDILHLISKAYAYQIILQAIQFSTCGDGTQDITTTCASYISSLNYAVSTLSALYLREYPCTNVSICDIIDFVNMECGYDLPSPLSYNEALNIIVGLMDDIVASLEMLCYNLPSYEALELGYTIKDIKNTLSYEHKILGF